MEDAIQTDAETRPTFYKKLGKITIIPNYFILGRSKDATVSPTISPRDKGTPDTILLYGKGNAVFLIHRDSGLSASFLPL